MQPTYKLASGHVCLPSTDTVANRITHGITNKVSHRLAHGITNKSSHRLAHGITDSGTIVGDTHSNPHSRTNGRADC